LAGERGHANSNYIIPEDPRGESPQMLKISTDLGTGHVNLGDGDKLDQSKGAGKND
jgi:hypothetical protein